MIIFNQLKIFYLFFTVFVHNIFSRWMAYNHLITFDFVNSMFFYNLSFVFICNCFWLVIYNPVLLIAIWPPSPSLSLWSPPRSGEWSTGCTYVKEQSIFASKKCQKMFKQNLFTTISKTRKCKNLLRESAEMCVRAKTCFIVQLTLTSTWSYHVVSRNKYSNK